MIHRFVANITHALQPFGLLLARLAMAAIFLPAGYGKIMNLAQVTGFFQSIGIPMASVLAPTIAVLEITGAVALAFGVFTELFAVLLMGVMIVATITAKHADIHDFKELLSTADVLYAIILMLIAMFGPGRFAVLKSRD